MDEDTPQHLKELSPSPQDPPQISTELKTQAVMKACGMWPESTMTLPLGRHLGMHKVWLKHSEDEDIFTGEQFFQIIMTIMQISI